MTHEAGISKSLKKELTKDFFDSWSKNRENFIKLYSKVIFNATYCSFEEATEKASNIVDRKFGPCSR